MARVFLTLSLLFIVLSAHTKERSSIEKQRLASSYLQRYTTRAISTSSFTELQVLEGLTVVGNDDKGFVVIPNDDRFAEIIGYSEEHYQGTSPAFKWWLDEVNEILSSKNTISLSSTYSASAKNDRKEPLIATQWGQDAPYNILCPKDNQGTTCPTGCVATAMGQLMYYYQHPDKGYGKGSYSTLGIVTNLSLEGEKYQWDTMLPHYDKGSYTEDQAQAIGMLMLHCGAAVNMVYAPNGSAAYSYDAASALRTNFGYNENLQIKYRQFYNTSAWMNILYEELDANRPVIYSGTDNSYGGHCFLVDGYDENGFVHVNWGWEGYDDGYYDIALLNPSKYSFLNGQNMICGVALPSTHITYHSEVCAEQDFQVTTLGTRLFITDHYYYNMSDLPFNGVMAYILQGEGQTYILASVNNEDVTTSYSLTKPQVDFVNVSSEIPDGSYRLFPAVKTEKDETWEPIKFTEGCVNSWNIKKTGTSLITSAITDAAWMVTDIKQTSVEIRQKDLDKLYNIKGQQVDSSYHGVVIKNGHKYVQ